ncbi:MAG: thioredoxin family protein [Candidatus Auribacterota bacterium]|nr:thioredoxin family protein [Candidatus Auribacterota bacterium]
MFKQISKELRRHAPFTVFGAVTGIIIIAFSRKLPQNVSYNIFYILHPIHVILSALVTASQFRVMSIPALAVFKNSEIVNQVVGALPKEELEAAVKPHIQ